MKELIMLVGLPGSGKSYYANQLAGEGYVVHSSDSIREEILGDINNQTSNDKVFRILHKRIKEDLKSGNNVVYDATNLHSKRRRAFINEIKNIECKKICVIIARPYEECLLTNNNRDRVASEDVISRMYKSWDTPYWFEGWDSIKIHYPKEEYRLICKSELLMAENLRLFDQENPHHKLTLGDHLIKTYEYIAIMNSDMNTPELRKAAILHDIGKVFTKTVTDVAHYYCHEHVGAYDSLFIGNHTYVLDTSVLINLHMIPYGWERNSIYGEKTRRKYENLWGKELYEKVMLLHEADKAAH